MLVPLLFVAELVRAFCFLTICWLLLGWLVISALVIVLLVIVLLVIVLLVIVLLVIVLLVIVLQRSMRGGKPIMSFAFCVSLFGFAFAIRTLSNLTARNLVARNELPKIGTTYFAFAILLIVTLPTTRLSLWCAIFLPMGLIAIALYAALIRRSKEFRDSFTEALSITLLKMKSGKAFRQAFSETIAESEARMRNKLAEVGSVVVFSQQKSEIRTDPFVARAIDELTSIDRQPHSSMRRLTIFRDRLRLEDDFRRRSGQVLARIRAQSFVMSGLYLAVLVFVVWKFGWQANLQIVFVSFVSFTIGALWIWFGGRSLKWKA